MDVPRQRWLVFAVLVATAGGCSRNRDPMIARVEGTIITGSQFHDRYVKYLAMSNRRDNILVREEIANNMVNEVLIENDLRGKGLDNDRSAREKFAQFTEQALLDGYARHISTDTMKITERELYDEFRAFNGKAAVRYVYGKTETDAWAIRKRLETGESFQQVAKEVFQDPDLARNGGYTGYFGHEEMDPEFEHAAFSLPLGALSDPIRIQAGYAILEVVDRVENPIASEADFAKRKPALEQEILRRKAVEYVKAEADRVSGQLHAQFDDARVADILQSWDAITSSIADRPSGADQAVLNDSIAGLQLVKFTNSAWTVRKFVGELARTTERQRSQVKSAQDVKDIALGLASRDVLVALARNAGLESDSRVREQIQRLKKEWLLKRWSSLVQDSLHKAGISDDELLRQYNANRQDYSDPPEISVAEILVRSSHEADSLARLVRKGHDFGALARQNSIRTATAKTGGMLGYQPPAAFGQYSTLMLKARGGEIVGPLAVEQYFGVYKIIGRSPGRQMTFEEARPLLLRQLMPQREREVFQRAVQALRARTPIELNLQALGSLVVSPT